MSSKGHVYNVYISPFSSAVLNAVSMIKLDNSGSLYQSAPGSSYLLSSIGVGRMSRPLPEIVDSRKRSGFLSIARAIEKQPHAEHYMDIGFTDGKPYQGNGVLVFKIPTSVRTSLQNQYFNFGINMVDVSDTVRTIVDNHYTSNANYTVSDMNLTTEQTTEAEAYVQFIEECRLSAENHIRSIIKKHVAYGTYPIIVYK